MEKAQKIFDTKVSDLVKFIEKFDELTDVVDRISVEEFENKKKDKSFTPTEESDLYDLGILASLIRNKHIEIIEYKRILSLIDVKINYDSYYDITNAIDFEKSYYEFLKQQEFAVVNNDKVVINDKIKKEHLKGYMEKLYAN